MFYLDLFRTLEEARIRYLLVGGLAMNLHGVPRMTMDVDVVLAMDPANLQAFVDLAKRMRLRPVAPVSIESLLDPDVLRRWKQDKGMVAFALKGTDPGAPTVDILIEAPLDFESAYRRAEHRLLQNVRVTLAAIDDLISLKSGTGRAQDQADVQHLRRLKAR